jgi:hypothetical protein
LNIIPRSFIGIVHFFYGFRFNPANSALGRISHYHFGPRFNRYKGMKHLLFFCFKFALIGLLFSCATRHKAIIPETAGTSGSVPQNTATGGSENFRLAGRNPVSERTNIPVRTEGAGGPERPEPVPIPEYLMGKGLTTAGQLASFLLSYNPQAGADFTGNLSRFYVEEAAA